MKNSAFILITALLFSALSANSQSIVVTTPQERNVVLEEYTGIKCQYCPGGHAIAQAMADANPDRVVLVNIHQGSYAVPSAGQPDFRTSFGDALATNASVASVGYPSGTVNRHLFSGLSTTMAMSRSVWNQAAEQILPQPSPVNTGFTSSYNSGNGELTVNVELYYTENSPQSTNFIHVALLQNHVLGYQVEWTPSGVIYHNDYDHKHILRHFLTGQWGDTVYNTAQGTLIQRTYVYTVPAMYNNTACDIANCDVAVYVSETKNEIYTGGVKPVGQTFDGDVSIFAGNFNPPVNSFVQGTQGITNTFQFSAFSALQGSEDFTFTLTDDAPGDWNGEFIINGNTYTNTATVPLSYNVPLDITVNVTPGSSPELAKYVLSMNPVNYPTANEHIMELYVISGITDLIVNGSGGWGDAGNYDWESVYVDGLNYAGNTTFKAIDADVMVKASTSNSLTQVGHIYMNIGWTFPSFTDEEATALMNFMDNGGNVMFCGQDIGWDIKSGSGYGTPVTNNLYTNYMHAVYGSDGGTAQNSLNPVVTDAIFGTVGITPVIDVYNNNFYPDIISPTGGSVAVFSYGTSNNKGGVRFTNGTYKMVYIAPGMEQLSNVAVKNEILKQTHDWFHGLTNVNEVNATPFDIIVYPNPASDRLYFDAFNFSTSGISANITDVTGKTVLVISDIKANEPVDISGLVQGFYFIGLSDGTENTFVKFQVIR